MYRKYGSRKTECRHGHLHDSQKEAIRCNELHLLEKAGEIKNLKQQPKFTLLEPFEYQGKKIRGITYRADFSYLDRGEFIVEDTKGYKTKEYQLKRKLLLSNMANTKNFNFIES